MTSSIENWIEELIEKKIQQKCLASKGFVKSCIMEEKHKGNKETGQHYCHCHNNNTREVWSETDTQLLKMCMNALVQECSKKLQRSKASVRAKMFRILQKNYQEVL
jgi:hypothetical protein